MQMKIPLGLRSCYYECVNPLCFYDEHQMSFDEVVWKHVWNNELGDLDYVAHCPSCQEEMIFWEVSNGTPSQNDPS